MVAVTVDHGLRPEAAAEAQRVGEIAGRLGARHVVKRWTGEKPKSGLMEAAREARHHLISEAALEVGTDLVLVGHTLDDQAETVAMRGKRGTGRGASGMAEATLYDGTTWFARPLLGIRRSALRQVLVDADRGWIDDPSNDDRRYERVRTRAVLDDAAIRKLGADARVAGDERQVLGQRAAQLIGRHASMPAAGLYRVDPALAEVPDVQAATYALRALLATAGGQAHLPDEARAADLLGRQANGPCRATLSRAVAERRKAGIFIYREKRNLPKKAAYAEGVWDGRFRLTGAGQSGLSVGVPDADTATTLADAENEVAPPYLIRSAAASQPALWNTGECQGLAADARGITCHPLVAPWARYLPSFDLEIAGAMARLTGAEEPPCRPFADHNWREV